MKRAPPVGQRPQPRDWPWPALIVGYFAFQILWRRLLGGGFGLDEAQMYLWAREPPALGYGPQPPLYGWLQWAVFQVVPDALLALSLLKNVLLAGTYLAVFALLRTAAAPQVAGLAAASLMLVPQIAWDSQRDMTHSVLVVTLTAVAALVFWTRALPGSRGGWVGFGVALGCGLLAKANFAVAATALLAAAATLAPVRRRVAPADLALAFLVATVIVAAPLWWAVANRGEAFASVEELKATGGVAAGLLAMTGALLACLALAGVVLGGVFWVWQDGPAEEPADLERLLARTALIGIALTVAGVLATGTTHVREMWLLPVVFWLVPVAAVWVQGRVADRGIRVLRGVVVGLGLLVTAALAVHMRYGDPGHPTIRRAPVDVVAADLVARFPDATRIVADPDWLAANLMRVRPDLPVVASRRPGPPPAAGESVVLVWWTPDRRAEERRMALLASHWGEAPLVGDPVAFEAPFPPQPGKTFRVDAARVTMP